MGNDGRSKVYGKGNVDLVFTSSKKVILTNVFYVPDVNRNIISGDLLNLVGIKSVFESRKLILTRNGVFVGKSYSCDRMVKLCNTLDALCTTSNNNKNNVSIYMLDSSTLWHHRLGHVGLNFIKRMIKSGIISCDVNNF